MKPETIQEQFKNMDIGLFFTIANITCDKDDMERLKNNGLTTVRKLLNNLDSCHIKVGKGYRWNNGNKSEDKFLFEILEEIELKISNGYEKSKIMKKYTEHHKWEIAYNMNTAFASFVAGAFITSYESLK